MLSENNILIQRNASKGKNHISVTVLSLGHNAMIIYSGLVLYRDLIWSSSGFVPLPRTRNLGGPSRGACPEPGSPRNALCKQPGPASRACTGLLPGFILPGMDSAVSWLKRWPGYCLGRWRFEPQCGGWSAQCVCETCVGVRRKGGWAVGWGFALFFSAPYSVAEF